MKVKELIETSLFIPFDIKVYKSEEEEGHYYNESFYKNYVKRVINDFGECRVISWAYSSEDGSELDIWLY